MVTKATPLHYSSRKSRDPSQSVPQSQTGQRKCSPLDPEEPEKEVFNKIKNKKVLTNIALKFKCNKPDKNII